MLRSFSGRRPGRCKNAGQPGDRQQTDGMAPHHPAPVRVADNRIVFHLPFTWGGRGGTGGLRYAAKGATDAALRQRFGEPGPAQPLWTALDAAAARQQLSGDLYPAVDHVLNGDGSSDSGLPPLQAVRKGMAGAWLAQVPLHLVVDDEEIALHVVDAGLRLFGTGIGLLTVGLRLERCEGPLHAEPLLRALHALAQPARREGVAVQRARRFSVHAVAQPVKPGALLAERAGALVPVQVAEYARLQRQAGGELPLYRAVAMLDPAPPGGALRVRAERLRPQVAAAEGEGIRRNTRLVLEPEGPGWRARAAGDDEPTHVALAAPQGGQVWAHALAPAHPWWVWMQDFLPPGAKPHLARPEGGDGAPGRLFSYAAVRIDPLDAADATARCRELAYRLSRRFDAAYQPAADEMARAVLAPFDTVYHAVATQGAGLVVHDTGADFLHHYLSTAFATVYRPLAELCLHEYVHLLDLVQHSAFVPRQPPHASDIWRLESLVDALARYRLYFRFSKLSHMAHHNEVLALWRRSLGVDVIETELAKDVGEAHRLLAEQDEQRKTRRWRVLAAAGASMVAFLSVSEGFDRWAQSRCPPEALAIAATDLQIHGGDERLFDLLVAFRKEHPAEGREAWLPQMDRLCAWREARAAAAPQAAASSLESLLRKKVSEELKTTLDERLANVCRMSEEARSCAADASRWRNRGLWLSLAAALITLVLALRFAPQSR